MASPTNFRVECLIDGKRTKTLADILPKHGHVRVLLVGKAPTQVSVDAGHYFQGRQGRMFWNRLREHGLLTRRQEAFEDEALLDHGYGMTDIVKRPCRYGEEPTDEEYRCGADRILSLIPDQRPRVVCFVYKGVLDQVLKIRFAVREKAIYGFNPKAESLFGCRVFAFPMPGTPCTRAIASKAMAELKAVVDAGPGPHPSE